MIKTVLSIDDDDVTQILNNVYLESFGYCQIVMTAYNGIEALDIIRKFENGEESMENFPDIIFLDLNMPVMDGWEFYDAFLNGFPSLIDKTKIFILSSSINPQDAERVKGEKHIVSFLSKPLNEDSLKKVKRLIGV
jgi:CheY-like chemotaxis protein